jgi:hypothetical protein
MNGNGLRLERAELAVQVAQFFGHRQIGNVEPHFRADVVFKWTADSERIIRDVR